MKYINLKILWIILIQFTNNILKFYLSRLTSIIFRESLVGNFLLKLHRSNKKNSKFRHKKIVLKNLKNFNSFNWLFILFGTNEFDKKRLFEEYIKY